MTSVVAIRHVAFEDLGLLAGILRERGCEVAYQDAWSLDEPAADAADLLIVLGGPISANDTQGYPFVTTEIELARRRVEQNRPLLGICLGAQVIACAIGGKVGPGAEKEIGWAPLDLTDAGLASPLRQLEGVPVLHWHGEVCHLPKGVPSLAVTRACAAQAFSPAERTLALQFHAEAGTTGIEPWLVGHTMELSATPDVTLRQLREDTRRFGATLERAGRLMLGEWLDGAGI